VLARRQLLVPVLQFRAAVTRLGDQEIAGDQRGRRRQHCAFPTSRLADKFANVRRTIALPEKVERGSLTLLRATVAKVAKDSGYPDRTT
jgi:hypothetical protein